MAVCKSSLVAAMMRTSAALSLVLPNGLKRLDSNARSSICCTSNDRLPISSRNNVPPFASSQTPCLLLSAPVNAPFSCPNSSDAASSFDSRPQSTGLKGFPDLLLLACIFSAMCSLPVPLSPNIRTLMFVGATSLILSYIVLKASLVRSRMGASCRFILFCKLRSNGGKFISKRSLGM